MKKLQKGIKEEQIISIKKAAELSKVTQQAIYVAIKKKKLKASKNGSRWSIQVKDLKEYRKNRYSREYSFYEGKPIFDKEKGFYSIREVAEILKVPKQKIYYATRENQIISSRKGGALVIHIDDVVKYLHNYLLKERKASFQQVKNLSV